MKNITKELSKNLEGIKEGINSTKKVSGIEPYLLEFSAEFLGNILNDKVLLRDSGENLEKKLFTIKTGDIFDINKLLDLGYTRVERVWCEGEISILGDVVIVWPFSMNNLLRISLLGKKIEGMAVVDSQTRKKIKDVNERAFVSEGSKIYIGNEDSSGEVIIDIVPRVSEEEYIDLELRSIPGIENFSNPKILKEIVKNFVNQYIQYVDLYNDKPTGARVTLVINNSMEIPLKQKIYFAPNCKKEISYCLTHPLHAYWFLRPYLGDRFRK